MRRGGHTRTGDEAFGDGASRGTIEGTRRRRYAVCATANLWMACKRLMQLEDECVCKMAWEHVVGVKTSSQ